MEWSRLVARHWGVGRGAGGRCQLAQRAVRGGGLHGGVPGRASVARAPPGAETDLPADRVEVAGDFLCGEFARAFVEHGGHELRTAGRLGGVDQAAADRVGLDVHHGEVGHSAHEHAQPVGQLDGLDVRFGLCLAFGHGFRRSAGRGDYHAVEPLGTEVLAGHLPDLFCRDLLDAPDVLLVEQRIGGGHVVAAERVGHLLDGLLTEDQFGSLLLLRFAQFLLADQFVTKSVDFYEHFRGELFPAIRGSCGKDAEPSANKGRRVTG